MTTEEAKQVLLRIIECDKVDAVDCLHRVCRACEYYYTHDDKITAMNVAVKCIDLVEQVIGENNDS